MPHELLEQTLSNAEDEVERRWAFKMLARRHAELLVRRARLRAGNLGLSPNDGDAALSQAFIRLCGGLHRPWPAGLSFARRLDKEVWSELRHRRADLGRRRQRFSSLSSLSEGRISATDPTDQYVARSRLARRWRQVCDALPAKQRPRLLFVRGLRTLGFEWSQIKTEAGWSGSRESLRESARRPEVLAHSRERQLTYARLLKKLGYRWREIKTEAEWSGSSESLRVSVYGFLRRNPSISDLLA